jgi:hypothetical protein
MMHKYTVRRVIGWLMTGVVSMKTNQGDFDFFPNIATIISADI